MSFFTALKLSFNNIRTKKGRTFLTALASSIGIIGIAVILSLSSGFQTQIDNFQRDTMAEFPIIISQSTTIINAESIATMQEEMKEEMRGTKEYADSDKVFPYDPSSTSFSHTNIFTDEYIDYINDISSDICNSIGFTRIVAMNMLRDINGTIGPVSLNSASSSGSGARNMTSMDGMGLSSYPTQLNGENESYLEKNYDLLYGEYPENETDLVLVIDSKNRVNYETLKNLDFETENIDSIDFEDIVGTEFKIISNDDYYSKTEFNTFVPSQDYDSMYTSSKSISVEISGIVRLKSDSDTGLLATGIAYSDGLSQLVIDSSKNSEIVKEQEASDRNVITMEEIDEEAKASFLSYLGGNANPYMIMVYPNDFEDKDKVLAYLDKFNENKDKEDKIIYNDLAQTMSDMTSGIMDGITIVLIAFASIALVVSLIMISIITYTSVLERTKEIGILRALGARKKDITRVFDAETCILGVFSGLLGVVIAWLLTFPINMILYNITELKNVATLQLKHAIFLVVISTILTILGGHIPAKMASRKDAVVALRSE